jgi:peroxiredoxin
LASKSTVGMRIFSPLLLAATCASMRTPPATMGVVSKAGKLIGQFRQKRDVKDVSQLIQPGDMLPEAIVEVSADGRQMKLADVMGTSSGMSLLVGMPGAFTPTCSTCHLPSLVEAAPRLEKLGLKTIAVITSNDRYVNEAWRKSIEDRMQSKMTLTMLSDADGAALRALGLVDDLGFGMGERANRFAVLAEDGKVRHVAMDEGMDNLDSTSVDALNKVLDYYTGNQIAPTGFHWAGIF